MPSPQPSYRSYLAVAKDTSNAVLTAAAAAGATTITVDNAGIAAASTVFFVDGVNSESKAVSAGGGSTTLTIAATTYAHPANCYVYAQPTASVGPTDYIPVTNISFLDNIAQLGDKGWRGSNVDDYGSADGVAHGEITVSGDVFADTIGYAVGSVFGATDFTAGTPNTHAFSVKNTADGQGTAQVLYVSTAVATRSFAQAKWENVSLTFDPAGLLKWQGKAIAKPSGVVAAPTSSFSTVNVTPVWQVTATINSVLSQTVMSATFDLKRNAVSPLHTLRGVQDPYRLFQGKMMVQGKCTFLMQDETELNYYLANNQVPVDFTFTTGTGAAQTSVTVHMTKANFSTGTPNLGKDWIELDASFDGLANTTDATTAGTGYSPAKVTLKNSKSTGTYI